jgi:inosose dehydratase
MTASFRIGHTGITWGYQLENIIDAVRDTAALGYAGFETFGDTIEAYNAAYPAGFGALLAEHSLPLAAIYCPVWARGPAEVQGSIDEVLRWARLAHGLGAQAVVVQGGRRTSEPFTDFAFLVQTFNEIGRRLADLGLVTAIHPHTGTLIETRAEIDAVLSAVDPRLVGFAPDTGQILKGGSEVMAVLRDYQSLIGHVHLKDYIGGPLPSDEHGKEIDRTGYSNYQPLGQGAIDFRPVFALLEEIGFSGWVMVELDATGTFPRPPREAAQISRDYLRQTLGAAFPAA